MKDDPFVVFLSILLFICIVIIASYSFQNDEETIKQEIPIATELQGGAILCITYRENMDCFVKQVPQGKQGIPKQSVSLYQSVFVTEEF